MDPRQQTFRSVRPLILSWERAHLGHESGSFSGCADILIIFRVLPDVLCMQIPLQCVLQVRRAVTFRYGSSKNCISHTYQSRMEASYVLFDQSASQSALGSIGLLNREFSLSVRSFSASSAEVETRSLAPSSRVMSLVECPSRPNPES